MDPQATGVEKAAAPYGSWESPISADAVFAAEKEVHGLAVAGDGRVLWVETRPEEGGREVLVKEGASADGGNLDVTPQEFAVGSLAQMYGYGGAFAVQGDVVVFSNYTDQRLYRQTIGDNSPLPLTPDYGGSVVRFADGVFDPHFSRYVTIMEDHCKSSNPIATVVAVSTNVAEVNEPTVLVRGNDFYAFPRIDPTEKRMAWIEWSNPNMSWDKAQLWVGYFSGEGDVQKRICIAGEDPEFVESPTEPKWSSKGELFFITDRQNGFWNIHKWVSGDGSFYVEGASATLLVSIAKVTLDEKRTMATDISIVWSSLDEIKKYTSYFSLPEFMEFPTVIPGQHSYAYFYPPHNLIFQGSSNEKPPLLVRTHGGPTDEARGVLDLSVQYWTSRGWALVDVNHGGSAGYGREFRERLLGKWGVVDVNDCCSCATFLVETGRVDGQRLCITGECAGGFTTLACLAFRQIFKAGASLYGIADLASLRAFARKGDAYYIDNLVGNEQAYFERSPINFAERFTCPVILFQGLEDTVVPPDQARTIYKAIKDKGLPVALVEYEGEPHVFRKAENIKFTLEQAMMFFARLVGHFKVADVITPIKIDNFD
ncbi:hypothetical protein CFC21_059816 [Triticum aestivum]|uniref:Peptidase S9 prolyl oligopeptidase catalytic domain-containing protein n=3 Tax=Triticum TaxID=4564 RepID=A0A9R0TD72_TRITD|nr:hypothetical protein CFC21_059816 [Triticum aestivum]VAI11585.1 unnamed protein product [Triticum turgidum subsp. durum]